MIRYRRLSYRYTMVVRAGQAWPLGDPWQSDRVRLLVEGRWRPDADTYETATTIESVVDLAGVDEGDLDVQLFEDVLVVEGYRHLPARENGALYHSARIRQGPFQVALPLPAPVDPESAEVRYDRGLLRVSLRKLRPS